MIDLPDTILPLIGFILSETVMLFLTSPVISALLIIIGLSGIFYTIKTGHISIMAAIGLVAIALFFGAQYSVNLAGYFEIVMFVVGVALIILEVFALPGAGLVGVLGALIVISSLFLSLVGNLSLLTYDSVLIPLYTLAGALVGLVGFSALIVRYLPETAAFNQLIHEESHLSLAEGPQRRGHPEPGVEGVAVTALRPTGIVEIGTSRHEVSTEGEYIQAGERVRVVRLDGKRVMVRRV